MSKNQWSKDLWQEDTTILDPTREGFTGLGIDFRTNHICDSQRQPALRTQINERLQFTRCIVGHQVNHQAGVKAIAQTEPVHRSNRDSDWIVPVPPSITVLI